MTDEASAVHVFGEDQVVKLMGLTRGQLRRWDREGFFSPRRAYEDRRAANRDSLA